MPLTFSAFRATNVARCLRWHPQGIQSWSTSDWLTAVTGELGELASLIKMRNRERDGLPGNKFSPTEKQIADELADVVTYLDLLAAAVGVDLGHAVAVKFNEVSERVGFPDRIEVEQPTDAVVAPQPSDPIRTMRAEFEAMSNDRKAYRVTIDSLDETCIVYADKPNEARAVAVRDAREAGFRITYTESKARRAKDFDTALRIGSTERPKMLVCYSPAYLSKQP